MKTYFLFHDRWTEYIKADWDAARFPFDGFVVIETADAVAVLPQREAQSIKTIVDRLKRAGRSEVRETPAPSARRADR